MSRPRKALRPRHGGTWSQMGDPTTNPMGVEGSGSRWDSAFVLSSATGARLLVVQRAMAADSMSPRAPHAADRRRGRRCCFRSWSSYRA